MKVAITTLFVIGATLTQAIAIADPNAITEAGKPRKGLVGFCGVPGQSCARDAAPEADADPKKRKGWVGFCGVPGQSCARLKRSAEAVADALAIADPAKKRKGWVGFCGVPGQSCAKARRSILEVGEAVEEAVSNIYAREAEAEADPAKKRKGWVGFCGVPGQSCARDAAAEPAKKRKGWVGFCGVPGQSCARDAAPEAEADPAKKRKGWVGFCGVPGQSCARVKRDAEADAEAGKRKGWVGFCGVPGQSCARDAAEEANVARSIEAAEPGFFKRTRDAEDGEGTALRAAHAAFMEVKRDSEAHASETPFQLMTRCGDYDCNEEAVAAIAARATGTFEERDAEACTAPGGACDIAKRQLDDIEAKLEAAVAAL